MEALTQAAPAEVVAKGINFKTFVRVYGREHGPDAVARVAAALHCELGQILTEDRLVSRAFYPIAWYRELHRVARREVRAGPEFHRWMGREAVSHDFSGVYRALTFVLTPSLVMKMAPRTLGAYYRGAHMYVTDARSSFTRARWINCHGFDSAVWQDLLGGCEAILTACGARDVRIELEAGGGDGDDSAVATATWS